MPVSFDENALKDYLQSLSEINIVKDKKLILAPVRHHSPACAYHVRRLIKQFQPKTVLIEAPIDFEPLISLLLDERTIPPVAIAAFLDDKSFLRRASYYPFCSHSPEYIAIKTADSIGAEIKFIDLPSSHRLMHEIDNDIEQPITAESLSLLDERLLDSSDYIHALAKRLGCRDGTEIWDHLFESRLNSDDPIRFFADVGAYCYAIRTATPALQINTDDTLPREAHMISCLLQALAAQEPVLILTGGFHMPAILEGIKSATAPQPTKPSSSKAKAYLIRYNFQQLDRLNGYSAGLPTPAFYERLWQAHEAKQANPLKSDSFWQHNTLNIFTDFSASERLSESARAPSTAVLKNTLQTAFDLADLRGHPGPLRVDIEDAALSNLVKNDIRASVEIEAFHQFLSGNKIGDIPPSAGSPPLLEHVRSRLRKHRFQLESSTRATRQLDIYRKPAHLTISRLLHLLSLVGVRFANLQSGPDFLYGTPSDTLFEHWEWSWSPQLEAGLIELSAYGDTLERVGVAIIGKQLAELTDQGSNNAVNVVRIFLQAMQAGLHDQASLIIPVIDEKINSDPELDSVTNALHSLFLAWNAREILGLVDSVDAEEILLRAYRRALYLLPTLADTTEDKINARVKALLTLTDLVQGCRESENRIDVTLYDQAIDRLAKVELAAILSGAIAALLVLTGSRKSDFLVQRIQGSLMGAYANSEDKIGALSGVIRVAPELLYRTPGLLEVVNQIISSLDETDFIALLPHLRLAFTALNPQESERVTERLAEIFGLKQSYFDVSQTNDMSEAELAFNLQLMNDLNTAFTDDGLDHWINLQS